MSNRFKLFSCLILMCFLGCEKTLTKTIHVDGYVIKQIGIPDAFLGDIDKASKSLELKNTNGAVVAYEDRYALVLPSGERITITACDRVGGHFKFHEAMRKIKTLNSDYDLVESAHHSWVIARFLFNKDREIAYCFSKVAGWGEVMVKFNMIQIDMDAVHLFLDGLDFEQKRIQKP